jgi:hypothetical protein
MRASTRIAGLLGATLLIAACADDPIPLTAQVNYTTCVGRLGTCSGDACCANQNLRHMGDEADVECEVRGGDLEGTVRLTFRVESPGADGDPAVWGTDLTFSDTSSDNPMPVRGMAEFGISEGGNDYPAEAFDRLDVREIPEGGGGCELSAHIRNGNEIHGGFECKELQLPSQELYLSSVYNGAVGTGEYLIKGCDFRN